MQIHKDRYTYAFAFYLVGLMLSLHYFDVDRKKLGISLIGGSAYLAYLMLFSKTRLHIARGGVVDDLIQNDEFSVGVKPENGTKQNLDLKANNFPVKGIDGFKWLNKRYKIVDGADVYINKTGQVKACGPGSFVMQALRGANQAEPEAIQGLPGWD